MRVVIVTGLSGAGKTRAIRSLEDVGYYCVDNMPPFLVSKFVEMCYNSQGKLPRVALVVDARGKEMFSELKGELKILNERGFEYEILFLEASDETIIKRYKETRRKHPLSAGVTVRDAIDSERELLADTKKIADYIIDTTNMKPEHLNENIKSLFSEVSDRENMVINIVSFGFKYGLPLDCDLVFDVRFMRNPFYVEELREKTGLEKEIIEYVMSSDEFKEFNVKLIDFIEYLIPQYIEEGKGNLVIGIGCTGGKHRSVVVAENLCNALRKENNCVINHRDIDR
ncbi:MAG: RNase adapter RapZ [Clostridia bacterium]|nr:RNase adapter RapZ [Clostridia bacterium]